MSAVVDARFAGGSIVIGTEDYIRDGSQRVILELPGRAVALLPSEARNLATALQATADAIEAARRPLRRPDDVDEHLREVDGL